MQKWFLRKMVLDQKSQKLKFILFLSSYKKKVKCAPDVTNYFASARLFHTGFQFKKAKFQALSQNWEEKTISFVVSVTVRKEHIGSRWTDFHDI
jgi:hypothetical protein